jgi:hypothetical protein
MTGPGPDYKPPLKQPLNNFEDQQRAREQAAADKKGLIESFTDMIREHMDAGFGNQDPNKPLNRERGNRQPKLMLWKPLPGQTG